MRLKKGKYLQIYNQMDKHMRHKYKKGRQKLLQYLWKLNDS